MFGKILADLQVEICSHQIKQSLYKQWKPFTAAVNIVGMDEKPDRNQNLPVYNIKAAARLVGLLPVTLRAWERRYGMPNPNRGEQGYRLYSEHDVRTLRWLKAQTDNGLTIGRAVQYLHELRLNGYDPAAEPIYQPRPQDSAAPSASPTLSALSSQLLDTLLNFDETNALAVMRRAFTLYPVDQVMMEVVQPILVRLGDAWHRGELPIAVEHYATQFFMQYLMSMMAAAAPSSHPGMIVAACAPGEQHQVGLLMLVVSLRWRGWSVKYLGPDLPLDRLEEALKPIRPQVLMFSANRVETAQKLTGLPSVLDKLPAPGPLILLGGQAFEQTRLPDDVPAVYLPPAPLPETVKRIEEIMLQQTARGAPLTNSQRS